MFRFLRRWKHQALYKGKIEVFISYSHTDEKKAFRIRDDLVRHKFRIWIDDERLKVGMCLPEIIQDAIRECTFFCLMVSPDALASRWVQLEYKLAQDEAKIILPCWLRQIDSANISHPWQQFDNIFFADFRNSYDNGIKKLLSGMGVSYQPDYPEIKEFIDELEKECNSIERDKVEELKKYFQIAYDSHKQDNNDQSIHKLEIIVRERPQLIIPKFALGVCYGLSERHKEAAREFEIVTKRFESNYIGWAGLGAAKYYIGEFEEAEIAFAKALKLRNYEAYELNNNYGRTLLSLHRYKDAIIQFSEASQRIKGDPNILAGLGTALLKVGQYQRAIEKFQEAQKVSSVPLVEVIMGLGEALEHLYRFDQAREVYTEGRLTNDPEVLRRLARLEWQLGNRNLSLQLYEELCQVKERQQIYLVEMAQFLHSLGHYDDMRAKCKECLRCQKVTAEEFYYVGLAYYMLSEKIAASTHYEEACKIDPVFKKFPYQRLF